MDKKQITAFLRRLDYKIIKRSWHKVKKGKSYMFNAYDSRGACHQFYINFDMRFAKRQMLSAISVLDACDITDWFFKEATK